ncbi:nucleotide-diphospho-sugar transferase [Lipomyces arxii]|uniref:nucleotide-diphospho-sugar transferase n=1 Tax=Lipomyces arxii TaxID=56418 RepID=UPI0034CD5DD4
MIGLVCLSSLIHLGTKVAKVDLSVVKAGFIKTNDFSKVTKPNKDNLFTPIFVPPPQDPADYQVGALGYEEFDIADLEDVKLEKAALVMLVRNTEIHKARLSIRSVEDRFNKFFHYPWIFLNDQTFSTEFIRLTQGLVSGNATYGEIPKQHWSLPHYIDRQSMREKMKKMASKNVVYGASESYRHMCRYFSGFFWRHPLLDDLDYYWRVEPDTQLFCDITYDPFKFMRESNKTYGFVINLKEIAPTIETLWPTVQQFVRSHPEHVHPNNAHEFIVNGHKSILDGKYNLCHFWSNFEIAALSMYRSQAYRDYFDALDQTGKFFYERWGDAPVHSIAASLFLDKEEIHWFYDMGYRHSPFTHCPEGKEEFHNSGKCFCNPQQNFDRSGHSCTREYRDMRKNLPTPGLRSAKMLNGARDRSMIVRKKVKLGQRPLKLLPGRAGAEQLRMLEEDSYALE